MKKPLKVLALLYDPLSQSTYSRIKQLDSEKLLRDMREIIDCDLVTCTEIEVEGKYFDVWSDDAALLSDKPIPNLYICEGLIIFGNLLFAKSGEDGEMLGLNHYEVQLLWKFISEQFPKLQNYLGRL